jgi:hypothetical protein
MDSFEALNFYRGVSARYDTTHPAVHETRRNRRPRDSALDFHEVADAWFNTRFGVPYRSQALLVTSKQLTAQAYAASPAHVMRIVPLTEYRYCWSPNATDLLFSAKKLAGASAREIETHLDSLAYREDELTSAHASGNEVMLHCARYITIPVDSPPQEHSSSIILPSKF